MRKKTLAGRAWPALAWGVAGFLAMQLGMTVLMEHARPDLRYPEFGVRMARLHARVAEAPGRPLLVVLGSSRVELGFAPDSLSGGSLAGLEPTVAFNFGMIQAGPLVELLCLRHMLAEGIRPTWVAVEVMPPFLNCPQEGYDFGLRYDIDRYGWGDLRVLRHYTTQPRELTCRWFLSRLTSCCTNRISIVNGYAPGWLPGYLRPEVWTAPDPWGWLAHPGPVSDEARRQRVDHSHTEYGANLADFRIGSGSDKALREILETCRREGITPVLLLMPEGSDFRSWYPATARAQIDAYVGKLGRQFGVRVVDARHWVADADFDDSHHMLVTGARAFTRRFGQEVLRPLLAERTLAREREQDFVSVPYTRTR